MNTMRDRFTEVTHAVLSEQPNTALILADIGTDRFEKLGTQRKFGGRVLNVGIREQLMLGVAAGFALEGFRPIAHSYAPFLVERAYEQLKLDMSHQGVGAVLVSVGASYDWAEAGRTHHAPGDVAVVAALPDWEIGVPGHPDEVEMLLRHAASIDTPYYLRLSDAANTTPAAISPGQFTAMRQGSRGAPVVVAVGPLLSPAMSALEDEDVTVLYATTVRPFDHAGLRQAVTGTDVILIEPYLVGTSVAEVSKALVDRPHRTLAIGVPHEENRRYGTREEHDQAFGLTAPGINRKVQDFLRTSRSH